MALPTAYGGSGDLLASGDVAVTGTWDFGDNEVRNVSILGVGTASPSDLVHVSAAGNANAWRIDDTWGTAGIGTNPEAIYALAIDPTTAGNGIHGVNMPSGALGCNFTGGAMTGGSGLKMINANDFALQLSSSTTNTVSIKSGAARSWHDTGFAFLFGKTTDTLGIAQFEQAVGGAEPVIELSQLDIDDSFINFKGTSAADGTRSISSDTTEDSAKFGAFQVEINAVRKWIRVYDDES